MYLIHHLITGIDTSRAPDAFQLITSIPNIDARWANPHTPVAIDAIRFFLGFCGLTSRFASFVILLNEDGIFV
jgi:hypothetical protein